MADMTDHVVDGAVVLGDTPFCRALARQQGGAVRIGVAEATDDPAAIAARSRAARLVAIDLPDDAATVALLAAFAGDGTPHTSPAPQDDEVGNSCTGPQLLANLRDPALRRIVDDNLYARHIVPRPRIVSTAALAAGRAVAEVRPYDLAFWRGQERVHAVLIGFSALGRHGFEDLVLAGIAGDLGKPRVTIVDPDPVVVRHRLDREMPEIEVSADVAILPFDPLTLTGPDGPLAQAEVAAPVTLIVLALDDPGAALATMSVIARMQDGEGQAVASVLVLTEADRAMLELGLPRGRPRDLGRTWTVRGGIEDDRDILDLVVNRADALAARIHDTYCARFGGTGDPSAPWPELRETYRRANRRAADHLPLKLWTLGLREPGGSSDAFGVDPHVYDSVVRPCASGASEDATVRRLSRIEHDRWCAERRLDGWRFGEIRDDARRIHPKLIPFDDPRFTDLDIEKDADQVRFLFGNVVTSSPGGAVTPLVIGILSAPGATAGIDVPSCLALCRRESWRPVVVISALLDPTECGLMAELAAEFDAEGRTWRLVVPEVTRDNREIRSVTADADTALLRAVLDRPSTCFAPIGGRLEPVDLWADPSAPDPHVAAIVAYVTARVTAVVDGTPATAG